MLLPITIISCHDKLSLTLIIINYVPWCFHTSAFMDFIHIQYIHACSHLIWFHSKCIINVPTMKSGPASDGHSWSTHFWAASLEFYICLPCNELLLISHLSCCVISSLCDGLGITELPYDGSGFTLLPYNGPGFTLLLCNGLSFTLLPCNGLGFT